MDQARRLVASVQRPRRVCARAQALVRALLRRQRAVRVRPRPAAQCVEGEPRVAQRLTGDAAPRPSRRRQVLHCQIHVQRVEVQL